MYFFTFFLSLSFSRFLYRALSLSISFASFHSINKKKLQRRNKKRRSVDIERPIDRDKAKEYKIREGNSMAF